MSVVSILMLPFTSNLVAACGENALPRSQLRKLQVGVDSRAFVA
jgi:hypothetical protein